MFRNISSKIFWTFVSVSLVQLIALAYFFGRSVVRETETFVWDSLSRRAQTNAASFEVEIKTGLTIAAAAKKLRLSLISEKGETIGENTENFDPMKIKDLIPSSSPSTQAIVTNCENQAAQEFICALSYAPSARAWIFDATPRATALQAIKKLSRELIGFAILILIFAILISYFSTLLIFRPLKLFVSAAQKISTGAFEKLSLPKGGKDEIGDLSKAFERMAEDLKARENSLAQSGLKLAHSARLASIGQMGASIAHEVKNPLTSMIGYAKILDQKIPEGELKEAAQIIANEADRCNQILGQMLKFARNDPSEKRPYALKDVIESTAALARAEAKRAHVEIKVDMRAEPIVVGSAQQVQQVLFNLLINAIHASRDAMQSKQGSKQVVIRCHEDKQVVIVDVEDHALGIPKSIQTRIFDPFFTTKDKKEGTGLGLSVALDIVQDQGGHLTFESEEGIGTIFHVQLPLA